MAAAFGRKIDDHRARPHRGDRLFVDQQRGLLSRNLRAGDDELHRRKMLGQRAAEPFLLIG
jgi:hypothetical protein